MLRLIALLMAFSLIACEQVERPDTDLCIINADAGNRKCFNMKDDYDDNGKLKPDAVAEYRANASLGSLDKSLVIDSEEDIANLKAYLQELRDAVKACKKNQSKDGSQLRDEFSLIK